MDLRSLSAFFARPSSARLTSSSAVASQPLSTLDRNGFTTLPFSGQIRSLAPVCGSYQL